MDHKNPSGYTLQCDGSVLDKAKPEGPLEGGGESLFLYSIISHDPMKNKNNFLAGPCMVMCLLAFLAIDYSSIDVLDIVTLAAAAITLVCIVIDARRRRKDNFF